ncbi:hypothetical protein CGSSp9BS68_06772 [Streptococcus pneumoniae SP9-BS68]|uniref:Uncharacterized protein n=1 Tax=Streptococcus pneumoniae serotype 4 (strain ATCC BAA-334 / TIGR4) TaxID=170187 RepID=A0A0H2URE5_STRPN|nr:hypothetical protein SP_1820 [Streptococcus pneumoniae TIGR4]EDK63413.1 hypothetical protein CGSSp11BS70_03154 [Streptococcus pneumoniae SP11-BS70]EDK71241.1 hypothetical protein CGSSp19BS75_07917 [Streptococcus pneumoniae SP19-BS75]EDK74672.1 hypothetical protein CGSSp3BS71_03577 [Streptococcus pneumoniae SP3-BS71]EDK79065.1 hypothetical protein CGSSp9BS68_06772 [Streptococcus pneumoniae SP9-BS68]
MAPRYQRPHTEVYSVCGLFSIRRLVYLLLGP